MIFPTLPSRPRYGETIDVFGGYNHNIRINENEFYDMENMTSDMAPVLSPRKRRGLYAKDVNVQGMISKDSLCYVDGRNFVINGYTIEMDLSTDAKDCPKQLVPMGAYVIIMPDKKYFNTADFNDFGAIEAATGAESAVTFTPCKMDGTEYTPEYIQSEEPKEPANMAFWMDTSTEPHSLKQYSSGSGMWVGVESTYVKVKCAGIGKPFSQYDGVEITFHDWNELQQVKALEGNHVLYGQGDDYLILSGILDSSVTKDVPMTVTREMPDMDFLIEHENRLWGCRYGLNKKGQVVNELYSCKLGDFKNWNCFMGISTDSYYVSLGSDGQFTGAIAHSGYPLFFKENCLHKVYGQIPANFSVQTTQCRGVQKGCSRSLAIVNEILYYKSRNSICAYDGALPTEVSSVLGEEHYEDAVSVAHGNKLYVSMRNTMTGNRSLFVFDTAKGMWHREDDINAYLFCSCRDELYCATDDGKILSMMGSGEKYEDKVDWWVETGILGGSLPEKKYLVKLNLRLVLEYGSRLHVQVQYDSVGSWCDLAMMTGTDLRCFTIHLKPRRCDHLRLRIEGEGPGMIYSITKTYSYGSDK